MTPEVGRHRDGTAADNQLVPLVLGLIRVLDQVAAAATVPAAAPTPPGAPDADDHVLDALLGVLSVRRTLGRWLAAIEAEAGPSDVSEPAVRPSGPLLR